MKLSSALKKVSTNTLKTYTLEELWDYVEKLSPKFRILLRHKQNKALELKRGDSLTKLKKLGIHGDHQITNNVTIQLSHATFKYSDTFATINGLSGCCGTLLMYDIDLMEWLSPEDDAKIPGLFLLKLIEAIAMHCNYTTIIATHLTSEEDSQVMTTYGFKETYKYNNARTGNDVSVFIKNTGLEYYSDDDDEDDY